MINVGKNPNGYIELDISGKIGPKEMQTGMEAFLAAVKDEEKIDCLYRIKDVEIPPLSAIAVELSYFPLLLGVLKKLDRVAAVANQGWVRTAARIESAVIPGLVIKTFEPHEEAQAIEWLAAND